VQAVERYVRQFRAADGRTRAGGAARPVPAASLVPKTRQITRWLLSRASSLDADDQAQLAAVTATCPRTWTPWTGTSGPSPR
jgi:hypothetical protein